MSATGARTARDRREAILNEAATLFASRGIGDASMADLADVVGIRKASLYHFFPSKQDLLMAVLRPIVEEPCRELDAIVSRPAGVRERFRDGAAALGDLFEREPERMEVLVRGRLERHLTKEHMEEIRHWKGAYTDLWRGLIIEGVTEGLFRPCDDKIAAFALIGSLNWMYAWFSPSSPLTGAEVAHQIADLFLHGLLASPEHEISRG